MAWKLFIGELKDGQPVDVAFVAGDGDAADNSWRELFSCKLISEQKPVVFALPCLVGHEARDVDRKRAAAAVVMADEAELKAAVSVLCTARPAKHGKGVDGASVRSGKQVAQLQGDDRVTRLREQVQVLVDKSKSAEYLNRSTGEPIYILTDGKWAKPVFSSDRKTLITAGCFH